MSRLIMLKLALTITCLSGCSVLPYEDEFACEKNLNLGKCVSVQQAYDEAANGANHGNYIYKDDDIAEKNSPPSSPSEDRSQHVPLEANSQTHQSEYIEEVRPPEPQEVYQTYQAHMLNRLTGLIKQSETPMVRPPVQIRTLILSYSLEDNKQRLYMPRFVYSIESNAQFVMGQYLLQDNPELLSLEELMSGGQ